MNFIYQEYSNIISNYHCPRYSELPNIDLYMDQVISILEKALHPLYDVKKEKIITPSMINNYVKQKIIPPPINKKYNNEQVSYLILICCFKKILSINDISEIISYMNENFLVEYDAFCDCFENALKTVFTSTDIPSNNINDKSQKTKLINSIIWALANKIYIEKVLESQKQ